MKKLTATVCTAAGIALPVAQATPAHAVDPIVWTEECPSGTVGRTVHFGDNTSTRTCYRLP